MARLNLSQPLSSDQAALHIAAGKTRFVGAVGKRSQLNMARIWLDEGSDDLVPADDEETRVRLSQLRQAICVELGGPDGLELKGWAWVWFAKQKCATSVHPRCEENWDAFISERSSDGRPAALRVPPFAAAERQLKERYVLAELVTQQFNMELAFALCEHGRISAKRKVEPRLTKWRSTGLEPAIGQALEKLLGKRPDLIARSHGARKFETSRLDRFDLYVALCKVCPALAGQRYSGATILKCLATLVACRRGRRPNAHPFNAGEAADLNEYVSKALGDSDWAHHFGFRWR